MGRFGRGLPVFGHVLSAVVLHDMMDVGRRDDRGRGVKPREGVRAVRRRMLNFMVVVMKDCACVVCVYDY
jgi:hypothetical protein